MAEYIIRGVPKSLLRDGWWLVENSVEFGKVTGKPIETPSTMAAVKDYAVSDLAS